MDNKTNERFIAVMSNPENVVAYTMSIQQLNKTIEMLRPMGVATQALEHFMLGFETLAAQMHQCSAQINANIEKIHESRKNPEVKQPKAKVEKVPKKKKEKLTPPPDNGKLSEEDIKRTYNIILKNVPGISNTK